MCSVRMIGLAFVPKSSPTLHHGNLAIISNPVRYYGPATFGFPVRRGGTQRAVRDGHSTDDGSTGSKLHVVEELEEKGGENDEHQAPAYNASAWGDPFKVEWVCTERLPF
ncbi:hypothetical protein BDN71DRAFT_1078190 [Pleurotus eryngii]|uniref:Uncharacterized protein n=1 Tax=Pleurotus eryngii TaxID=5323 RepID=A0A9P5ZXK6_PLEER|nr:hypothetical protein BDN71DRAFT_1078190 [Pleurotus eryngii]